MKRICLKCRKEFLSDDKYVDYRICKKCRNSPEVLISGSFGNTTGTKWTKKKDSPA